MFYYIEGKLAHLDYGFAVLDANGVGYKLTITQTTYEAMPPHLSVSEAPIVRLYTYMAVREDGVELFGFATESELEAFKLLITVSGVGPKAAMNILSIMTPERLAIAVCSEDIKSISKAQNVGSKTAARIVLELKDKLSDDTVIKSSGTAASAAPVNVTRGNISEAAEALMALGYDKNTVLASIRDIDPTKETGEIIKLALKKMSR